MSRYGSLSTPHHPHHPCLCYAIDVDEDLDADGGDPESDLDSNQNQIRVADLYPPPPDQIQIPVSETEDQALTSASLSNKVHHLDSSVPSTEAGSHPSPPSINGEEDEFLFLSGFDQGRGDEDVDIDAGFDYRGLSGSPASRGRSRSVASIVSAVDGQGSELYDYGGGRIRTS
ncbi:hypothetical protein DFH05DRAFT_1529176 [Lentinula detonsa]|uniref:Uncharacterized protein n=1 Tax=Lentinula detonsa TaxID=2804962 RepID=A0A9W8TTX3_9AGAR|nr:hypothetical protein DFH05DRAFT_1529176 [Lentinula detonsa]KAJ3982995.1 hypothetical protein F5890DRAFT_1555402 [Lentinula detonsa]